MKAPRPRKVRRGWSHQASVRLVSAKERSWGSGSGVAGSARLMQTLHAHSLRWREVRSSGGRSPSYRVERALDGKRPGTPVALVRGKDAAPSRSGVLREVEPPE